MNTHRLTFTTGSYAEAAGFYGKHKLPKEAGGRGGGVAAYAVASAG